MRLHSPSTKSDTQFSTPSLNSRRAPRPVLVGGDVGGDPLTGGGRHGQVPELRLLHSNVPVAVESLATEVFSPEPSDVDDRREGHNLPVSLLVVNHQQVEAFVLVDPGQLVGGRRVLSLVHLGRNNLEQGITVQAF